jgi:hypothetical protein
MSLPRLGLKPNLCTYVTYVINLGTYFKELNWKIFNQLTIVDHIQHHLWGLIP